MASEIPTEQQSPTPVTALSLNEGDPSTIDEQIPKHLAGRKERKAHRAAVLEHSDLLARLAACHSIGEALSVMAEWPQQGVSLHELSFFLRFFWWPWSPSAVALPESSGFFALPGSGLLSDDEEETFWMLAECAEGRTAAERHMTAYDMQMTSKLTNLTACGHYGDTIRDMLATPSAEEAPLQKLPFHPPMAPTLEVLVELFDFIAKYGDLPPHTNWLAKVELNNNHVVALELSGDTASRMAGRSSPCDVDDPVRCCNLIQSNMNRRDCHVQRLTIAECAAVMPQTWALIDKVSLYTFSVPPAVEKVVAAVRLCFDPQRLQTPVSTPSPVPLTWSDLLDGIYIINAVGGIALGHPFRIFKWLIEHHGELIKEEQASVLDQSSDQSSDQ